MTVESIVLDQRSEGGGEGWSYPILIGLLGRFQLVRAGVPLAVRRGGKTEGLLCALALRPGYRIDRDTLLELLWPGSDPARATHSLNSLVHALRQQLSGAIGGAPPIVYAHGGYELNTDAGVTVDVARFEECADAGDRLMRSGDVLCALKSYEDAAAIYTGDVIPGGDLHTLVERERLRARHLSVLVRLADYYFAAGDHTDALRRGLRLLAQDPCREDAHRLVMRCYARLGERAQALRQYQVCRRILAEEYGARPEPVTEALFDQLLTDPEHV